MKDFRDKKLYDDEVGLYQKFLNTKLETKSEYNKYATGEVEEEFEPDTNFLGLGEFGSDDLGGFSSGMDFGGFDDFGSGDMFGQSTNNQQDFSDWKNENGLDLFLKAPLYLSKYTFNSLIYNNKKNEEGVSEKKFWFDLSKAKEIFKYLGFTGLFLTTTSLLSKFTPINTLHDSTLGLVTGLTCILGGELSNWFIFNQGLIAKFYPNKNPYADKTSNEGSEDLEAGDFGEDMFGEQMSEDSMFNSELDDFSDVPEFDSNNLDFSSDFSSDFEDEDFSDFEEEDEDDEDFKDDTILAQSDVITQDDVLFQQGLIQEFQKNRRYKGVYLETRKETLDSFAGLLLNNDKKFAKWKTERERSTLFNNIAYTLYKALIDINKSFSRPNKEGQEDKLQIISIIHSPLLYKVQMRLPQGGYFKPDTIKNRATVFENYLKRDDADTEVQCFISVSSDIVTFRIIKMDYRGLISIGDILRYKDDGVKGTAYEQMTNPKALTPMLVGLRNNEYPHVVDLEKNTAMAIVGGSGSGKSWLTYELGTNIVTTNDYNEVNFVVLDYKNAPFWQAFSRMPHVIGYHSPNENEGYSATSFLEDVVEISAEIVQECNRRQSLLGKLGMEDAIELRTTYKKKKQFEKLKELPLLIFVVDEITSTMGELENLDKDLYDTFRNNLKTISQVGRSAGVRLLTVGQRAIDNSLPKNVRTNSTLLFGMKMQDEGEFNTLFGQAKAVEKLPKPTSTGLGIITSEDITGYHSLKTLTPGGKDTPQIRMLLRVMAFDWLRRSTGRDDLYQKPLNTKFEKLFNRPKFLEMSYADLREGRIFSDNPDLIAPVPEISEDLKTGKVVLGRATKVSEVVAQNNQGTVSKSDIKTENAYQNDLGFDNKDETDNLEEENFDFLNNDSIVADNASGIPDENHDIDSEDLEIEVEQPRESIYDSDYFANLFGSDDFEDDEEEDEDEENELDLLEDSSNLEESFEISFDKQDSEEQDSILVEQQALEEEKLRLSREAEELKRLRDLESQRLENERLQKEIDELRKQSQQSVVENSSNKLQEEPQQERVSSENSEETSDDDINIFDLVEDLDYESSQEENTSERNSEDNTYVRSNSFEETVKEPVQPVQEPVKQPEQRANTVPVQEPVNAGRTVQISYKQENLPNVQKSLNPNNLTVKEYIIEQGASLSMFEKYCSKEEVRKVFTPTEIKKALRLDIIETDDAYVASI